MRTVREGKREVRRLCFTTTVDNTEIPVIAADVVHNIRSGVDHLASSLVPPNHRRNAFFPIYWQGVWDDPAEGEDEQRTRSRRRWSELTSRMRPEAVAILKRFQPPDGAGDPSEVNFFRVLNKLSNTDKHEQFPTHVPALAYPVTFRWTGSDGNVGEGIVRGEGLRIMEDNAHLENIPKDAVDVEIHGTPLVALRVGEEHGYVPIPWLFQFGIDRIIRPDLLGPLLPFLLSHG